MRIEELAEFFKFMFLMINGLDDQRGIVFNYFEAIYLQQKAIAGLIQ